MNLILMLGVFVLVIIVVAVVIYLRSRDSDSTEHMIIITPSGTLEHRRLKRFQDTVRDNRLQVCEAFFLDLPARRRCASTGEAVVVAYQWSATPAYPGESAQFNKDRQAANASRLTQIAVANADRHASNASRQEANESSHQLARTIVTGTIVVVLVICLLVLFTSGKLNLPF